MNIMNILRTIKKLKAGLSVVINNDKELIAKAYKMYIKHSTQAFDSEQEKSIHHQDFFSIFLDNNMSKEELI